MTDSFDNDPLGNLDARVAQLNSAVGNIYQAAGQQQAQAQFVDAYQSQAAAFTQDHPDFKDAYNHAVSQRQEDLLAVGYSEAQAAQALVREEAQIVAKAMQEGVNPAERMYQYAQRRGYSPSTAARMASASTADELESAIMSQMEQDAATPTDPENITEDELNSIWDAMEKAERGNRPW